MTVHKKNIDIFNYTDYRKFLNDYYHAQKKEDRTFSYRVFAKNAGITSPGFYKDVVNGRSSITRPVIYRFASAMKLTKKQQHYFELMVYFNDAKTVEEKNHYFSQMMQYHRSRAYTVHKEQYEYFSKWYYVAVRELFSIRDLGDDYAEIARSLHPKIRREEAKKAVRILKNLGLIEKNSDGFYRAVNTVITSGAKVRSLNVANFQKNMADMAKQALDTVPSSQRNLSTLTCSVSKEVFDEISNEMDAVRKRILSMIQQDENEDRVCQLNLHLFPLSDVSTREERS